MSSELSTVTPPGDTAGGNLLQIVSKELHLRNWIVEGGLLERREIKGKVKNKDIQAVIAKYDTVWTVKICLEKGVRKKFRMLLLQ